MIEFRSTSLEKCEFRLRLLNRFEHDRFLFYEPLHLVKYLLRITRRNLIQDHFLGLQGLIVKLRPLSDILIERLFLSEECLE